MRRTSGKMVKAVSLPTVKVWPHVFPEEGLKMHLGYVACILKCSREKACKCTWVIWLAFYIPNFTRKIKTSTPNPLRAVSPKLSPAVR